MEVLLRPEEKKDHRAVEWLTKWAFDHWDRPDKQSDEHLLAHQLRKSRDFVPELCYVAQAAGPEEGGIRAGDIVGSIFYSRARVVNEKDEATTLLTIGPLSVHPACQKQGIGLKLLRQTLEKACALGYPAVLLFGHPDYYPRVGFRPASDFGIRTADGEETPALMAYECVPSGLEGISGRFYPGDVFHLDANELAAFDYLMEQELLQMGGA